MPASAEQTSIGVLASGGGTNLQAVIDACESGRLRATVSVVISNNSDSGALERARLHGAAAVHLSGRTHPDPDCLDHAVAATLEKHGVRIVVLAGYMKKLGHHTLRTYRNRILNIHPALLPAHGGQGMYGDRVHAAVIAAGERRTGVTVHIVNETYDDGPILSRRTVPVFPPDTVDTLKRRVLEVEHRLLVETIGLMIAGEIRVFDCVLQDREAAVTIRPVEPADGDLRSAQIVGAAGDARTADKVVERFRAGGTKLFGLFVERAQEGLAEVSETPADSAAREIIGLYVMPEHRGNGLGTALLDHAERYAAAAGAERSLVCLDGFPERPADWFERLGYRRTETAGRPGGADPCRNRMEKIL